MKNENQVKKLDLFFKILLNNYFPLENRSICLQHTVKIHSGC